MTDFAAMLNAYPAKRHPVDQDALVLCVPELLNCSQVCTSCADACLADPDAAELARCAAVTLQCADLCGVTVRFVTRQTGFDPGLVTTVLRACVESCRHCYEECRRHALEHEHCEICAAACLRCAHACKELLAALS